MHLTPRIFLPLSPHIRTPNSLLSHFSSSKTMKFIPKKLFKSKNKSRLSSSASRSETEDASFSSQTTSSSSSSSASLDVELAKGSTTPTSVLLPDPDDAVYLDLKQAFQMIDRHGHGKVKKEELESLLCRLGAEPPSQEELQTMLNEVDTDGDGCISLDEFCAIGSALAPPPCDSELMDVFEFFDSDRDGKITAEELMDVFLTIGDSRCTLEECRRMISGVDRNGDGFVCFEDFTSMMELKQR